MAAFTNGYNMTYPYSQNTNYIPQISMPVQQQPTPVQQQVPVQQSPVQQNTGIIWVQGESGAKAYPVAAGSSLVLFDSEKDIFYIKSSDQSGMPQPLRIFPYKETTEEELKRSNTINTSEFITRDEFERVINSLKYDKKKGGNINGKPAVSRESTE